MKSLHEAALAIAFLSTPSARRATMMLFGSVRAILFLSTPSARRATVCALSPHILRRHFYPRPPRGGRPAVIIALFVLRLISIHALREEGDTPVHRLLPSSFISIHALREEGDISTLQRSEAPKYYFYPRPPRGGRPWKDLRGFRKNDISIHALREEGDAAATLTTVHDRYFYPRPPRGGRLDLIPAFTGRIVISIHALREEGDLGALEGVYGREQDFYPRPPRGGRRATRRR